MADALRLSLCVIARNEAANLARCLESAAPVVQERIVVDTGSTDETAAIAERHGAAVSFFAWRDDFAAARNAALDRATGEWILWLDADEELLPESQSLVRREIERADAQAFYVLRQEVERDDQTDGFIEMHQLRLWRNDPSLRFVGRCHPHFGPLLDERERHTGQRTLDSGIRIRHTGYRPHLIPAKLERAAKLLQLELADRPGQMYYEIELGRTWCLLNDSRGPKLLNAVLERVLADGDAPEPPSTMAAALLLDCLRMEPPASPRIDMMILLAERWFPDWPPLVSAVAEACYVRGDLTRAVRYQQRLVRMAETGRYDRCIAFAAHILGDRPYLNLAVCLHRLGRLDEAERWYRRLLLRTPNHPGAAYNLTVLRQQRAQRRSLPRPK